MKQLLISIVFSILIQSSFGQTNYLDQGNQQLNREDYVGAEKTFRQGMQADSTNLIYQSQLALALMNQKKYAEAQRFIDNILLKDSTNIGALWYGGMNNFLNSNANLRTAISYFEKALPLLDEKQGQYYSANWFIGKSYQILLQKEGLSYDEVSRMLDCYSTYLRLQPNASDAQKIAAYVQHIKDIRPPENVKKWINQ